MKIFFKTIGVLVLGLACGIVAINTYHSIAISVSSAAIATAPRDTGAPIELIIPSINVDAPVKPVGVNAEGNIGVPADAEHVAWYKGGPRPGAFGVAIIDGHLDTKTTPQAVFYNLDQLVSGDIVKVRTTDQQTLTFVVTNTERIPYDASTSQVFASKSTAPQLVLITCTGDWVPAKKIYNERLVVFTQLLR